MLSDKDIAIYALGKTEGIHSIAETLGKGLDDEKYIESWNKTMKMLGIEMPLKELEKIYNEFAKKMDALTEDEKENLEKKSSTVNDAK
jgi:proteasome assembly chaperone (PAC2) family protein